MVGNRAIRYLDKFTIEKVNNLAHKSIGVAFKNNPKTTQTRKAIKYSSINEKSFMQLYIKLNNDLLINTQDKNMQIRQLETIVNQTQTYLISLQETITYERKINVSTKHKQTRIMNLVKKLRKGKKIKSNQTGTTLDKIWAHIKEIRETDSQTENSGISFDIDVIAQEKFPYENRIGLPGLIETIMHRSTPIVISDAEIENAIREVRNKTFTGAVINSYFL